MRRPRFAGAHRFTGWQRQKRFIFSNVPDAQTLTKESVPPPPPNACPSGGPPAVAPAWPRLPHRPACPVTATRGATVHPAGGGGAGRHHRVWRPGWGSGSPVYVGQGSGKGSTGVDNNSSHQTTVIVLKPQI